MARVYVGISDLKKDITASNTYRAKRIIIVNFISF